MDEYLGKLMMDSLARNHTQMEHNHDYCTIILYIDTLWFQGWKQNLNSTCIQEDLQNIPNYKIMESVGGSVNIPILIPVETGIIMQYQQGLKTAEYSFFWTLL